MNELNYFSDLEKQYDDLPEKLSDEEIEELWRMDECPVSDETIAEIYEKLEDWDENKHLYDIIKIGNFI